MGRASAGVTAVGAVTNITSDTAWCVAVTNPKGDVKNFVYSSAGGLETGSATALSGPLRPRNHCSALGAAVPRTAAPAACASLNRVFAAPVLKGMSAPVDDQLVTCGGS
jgi:hypothetical protein